MNKLLNSKQLRLALVSLVLLIGIVAEQLMSLSATIHAADDIRTQTPEVLQGPQPFPTLPIPPTPPQPPVLPSPPAQSTSVPTV